MKYKMLFKGLRGSELCGMERDLFRGESLCSWRYYLNMSVNRKTYKYGNGKPSTISSLKWSVKIYYSPCNNLPVGRTTRNTSSTCNVFFFLQRDRTVLDCTARISCPRPSPISKRSHPVSAYEVLIHLCLKSVCIPATTRDSSATEACTSIQISLVSHSQHIICFYHFICVFFTCIKSSTRSNHYGK